MEPVFSQCRRAGLFRARFIWQDGASGHSWRMHDGSGHSGKAAGQLHAGVPRAASVRWRRCVHLCPAGRGAGRGGAVARGHPVHPGHRARGRGPGGAQLPARRLGKGPRRGGAGIRAPSLRGHHRGAGQGQRRRHPAAHEHRPVRLHLLPDLQRNPGRAPGALAAGARPFRVRVRAGPVAPARRVHAVRMAQPRRNARPAQGAAHDLVPAVGLDHLRLRLPRGIPQPAGRDHAARRGAFAPRGRNRLRLHHDRFGRTAGAPGDGAGRHRRRARRHRPPLRARDAAEAFRPHRLFVAQPRRERLPREGRGLRLPRGLRLDRGRVRLYRRDIRPARPHAPSGRAVAAGRHRGGGAGQPVRQRGHHRAAAAAGRPGARGGRGRPFRARGAGNPR